MAELPDGYSTRAPVPGDAQLVTDLVAACELADAGVVQVELEDILGDWRRPAFDLSRDSILVLGPASDVVAIGEVFAGRAEGSVLPQHRGRGIGTVLAGWIEDRAREVGSATVRQVVTAHPGSVGVLERAGYERSDTAWELSIDLPRAARPGASRAPAPVDVRDMRPGVDEHAAFQLIEDAFSAWPNREPSTFDAWRALTIDRAGFEPTLLLLGWADDELVGAAYCIDYPGDGLLWVHQLAARVDRQGQGIGTAMLAACFELASRRGRTRLGLSTDSRTGALGLYERAGMRVVREFAGFTRRLG